VPELAQSFSVLHVSFLLSLSETYLSVIAPDLSTWITGVSCADGGFKSNLLDSHFWRDTRRRILIGPLNHRETDSRSFTTFYNFFKRINLRKRRFAYV